MPSLTADLSFHFRIKKYVTPEKFPYIFFILSRASSLKFVYSNLSVQSILEQTHKKYHNKHPKHFRINKENICNFLQPV